METSPQNRTRPRDSWLILWEALGFVCLGLLVAAMYMYNTAAPEPETFLDRATGARVRHTWDRGLVTASQQLLLGSFALSTLGVVVHALRRRHHAQGHLAAAFLVFMIASVGLWILFR